MDLRIVPPDGFQTLDHGQQFHAVVGREAESFRHLFLPSLAAQDDAVTARTRIAAGGSVGVEKYGRSVRVHSGNKSSKNLRLTKEAACVRVQNGRLVLIGWVDVVMASGRRAASLGLFAFPASGLCGRRSFLSLSLAPVSLSWVFATRSVHRVTRK